jgi:starch phosphorylase
MDSMYLLRELPLGLAELTELALDLRWTWSHAGDALWRRLDLWTWERTKNPTPRRPWEACGTSGMKVLVNGGLNLLELDGWWAEAYSPEIGWALGDGKEHSEPGWDSAEAEQLYYLLENEIVPEFYTRNSEGIPRSWVARMRASMAQLAPEFSSNRMVREYVEKIYLPAAYTFQHRSAQNGELAKELHSWATELKKYWYDVHFANIEVLQKEDKWSFSVQVYLGELEPDMVKIELYADPQDGEEAVCEPMKREDAIPSAVNGYFYHAQIAAMRPAEDFTPRVMPYHQEVRVPIEMH